MANKPETLPRQGGDTLDRSTVLRNVMAVLSEKGFAKASFADLKSAAGPGYRSLHKAIGTRDEILRAAIRFCADTEACLAQEPLRVSPTGREAILSMLEENVRYAGIGRDTVAASSPSAPSSLLRTRPTCRTSWPRSVVHSRSTSAHGSCNR
jgi:AcrR family transcriptional regulator